MGAWRIRLDLLRRSAMSVVSIYHVEPSYRSVIARSVISEKFYWGICFTGASLYLRARDRSFPDFFSSFALSIAIATLCRTHQL